MKCLINLYVLSISWPVLSYSKRFLIEAQRYIASDQRHITEEEFNSLRSIASSKKINLRIHELLETIRHKRLEIQITRDQKQ